MSTYGAASKETFLLGEEGRDIFSTLVKGTGLGASLSSSSQPVTLARGPGLVKEWKQARTRCV